MAFIARIVVWLLASCAAPLSAQVGGGALTGTVRDQLGAPLPGVALTAIDSSRGVARVTVSGSEGVFGISGLAPGIYRVTATLDGFRPLARDGIRVARGETLQLDFDLMVGDLRETTTVTGAPSLLRTSTAGLGDLVREERVTGLPLDGRSFVALTRLAPAVALPPGSSLPRINGGRPRTNEYLFDGISVLQPEPGQVAYLPVLDAIEELKIESNSPPAEFGRFNGGVVNLTTKSGTNSLKGTTFGFVRHEALNARNFFASAERAKPRFRRNQFGGVLGGPLRRERTFFFADYQGTRQQIGRTLISTVPTILQRAGIFTEPIEGRVPVIYDAATTVPTEGTGFSRAPFDGGIIPRDRLDPVALALLARYPVPTSPGTANNYRRTANEVARQDQFGIKVNHRLASGRDQAFARLTGAADEVTPVLALPDGSGTTSGALGPQRTRAWAFAGNYQRVLADQWINELRVGDTRRRTVRAATRLAGDGLPGVRIPGLPSDSAFADTLPTFLISGYQHLGSAPGTASDAGTSVTELADSMTWSAGRHTLKAGFDFRWQRLNVVQPPSPTGLFQFSSLFTDIPGVAGTGMPFASFLLGQVQTFAIDLQRRQIRNRASFQEYFIQDDWKISDRFSVAPGLRYTLNFPSYEEHDQGAVFNLATRQIEYLGREGHPRSARDLQKLDFGPRLGLVGRLTNRTVLGGGYALVWIEQTGITTPFTTPAFPFVQSVSQRTLDGVTPAFVLARGPSVAPIPPTPDAGVGQGVFAVDRDLGSGYVQQWNLSLQRELSGNTAIELAYIGSKITRVGIPDTNLNQLTVEQLALGPVLLQRVPNPFAGRIPTSSSLGDPTIPIAQLLKPYPEHTTVSLYRNNVGTTLYHGFTAKAGRRWSNGLTYSVSYTRSRLVDDASSVFDASVLTAPLANAPVADSFNRRLERDVSTGDIPHALVSSLVWELPRRLRGWTVSAIVTLQSGTPVAVTQATNFNAFAGFGVQRPNVVADPGLPAGERSPDRWFNTEAFRGAPQFRLGTSSRNPVRGPSYRSVDLALVRRQPVSSKLSVELRGEVFNALNTPALGNPNAVLGTAGFGSITSAGDPRVVQLAVKLIY